MTGSILDNNQYECNHCHLVQELGGEHDSTISPPPCPRCHRNSFSQVAVTIVCDFCSEPYEEPMQFWSYPCPDFKYTIQFPGETPQASKGDWACCEICHELIETDDRTGLALRSVQKDAERDPDFDNPEAKRLLLRIALTMHQDFFNHRNGDPHPETIIDGKRGGPPDAV